MWLLVRADICVPVFHLRKVSQSIAGALLAAPPSRAFPAECSGGKSFKLLHWCQKCVARDNSGVGGNSRRCFSSTLATARWSRSPEGCRFCAAELCRFCRTRCSVLDCEELKRRVCDVAHTGSTEVRGSVGDVRIAGNLCRRSRERRGRAEVLRAHFGRRGLSNALGIWRSRFLPSSQRSRVASAMADLHRVR